MKFSKRLKKGEAGQCMTIKVLNHLGLHARAAALFVKTASQFDAEVTIQKGRRRVNGKSIMGLLTLAAGRGSEITVVTNGRDAVEALGSLRELVKSKFGEE